MLLAWAFSLASVFVGLSKASNSALPVCEARFDYYCLWSSIQPNLNIQYDQAVSLCQPGDSKLAEIRNEAAQREIMVKLRQRINTVNGAGVRTWLGMTIDQAGDTNPSTIWKQWYPSFPVMTHGGTYATSVYLYVAVDPDSRYQGMINAGSNGNMHGALCEMETGPCEIRYQDFCYWVRNFPFGEYITFEEGKSLCTANHSTMAYPVDETHYNLLLDKIRSKIHDGRVSERIWTGLIINPNTGNVTTPSGEEAPYVKWYPSEEPDRDPTDTHIYLSVRTNAASENQGMFDTDPTNERNGVICKY